MSHSDVLTAGVVHSQVQDGIATVRFGHPKSNSLPRALLEELAATIARVGNDEAARVIVLQSDGGGPFCAGLPSYSSRSCVCP